MRKAEGSSSISRCSSADLPSLILHHPIQTSSYVFLLFSYDNHQYPLSPPIIDHKRLLMWCSCPFHWDDERHAVLYFCLDSQNRAYGQAHIRAQKPNQQTKASIDLNGRRFQCGWKVAFCLEGRSGLVFCNKYVVNNIFGT